MVLDSNLSSTQTELDKELLKTVGNDFFDIYTIYAIYITNGHFIFYFDVFY